MAKFTAKQQKFVTEYLIDLNATQAAIRAGYSSKTANQSGPRLLVDVGVAAAIAEAIQARSERTEITADRVLAELGKIAFADAEAMEAFADFGFRVSDKRAALVDIGRHLGMFPTKVEHTGKDGGAIEVSEVSRLERARRIAFLLNTAQPEKGNGLTKH